MGFQHGKISEEVIRYQLETRGPLRSLPMTVIFFGGDDDCKMNKCKSINVLSTYAGPLILLCIY